MTTFTKFDNIIKGMSPYETKATPFGLLLSFSINKEEQCALLIVRYGSVGIIRTKYPPRHFTLMEDSIYYSCWNTDENTTQIRCVSSTGVETPISSSRGIKDINTTRDNRCVVLSNQINLYKECLVFLNPDGSTDIIKKNLIEAKGFTITEQNTFLVIYEGGIQEVNLDGTSRRRVQFDNWSLKSSLRNLVSLPDSFLVVDERSIVKYRRDIDAIASTNCRRNEGEQIFGEQDFYDLEIGKYIKSFHVNHKGGITLLTTKGICCLRREFDFPQSETVEVSPYLWNPETVQIVRHSYQYAITFILCMNRIYQTDEELPEVPLELFHLMLSHSDMWSFPGKTLSLL